MVGRKEFCPRCRSVQAMNLSMVRKKVTDADGHSKKITTKTYHCAKCLQFVRSEQTEVQEQTSTL